MSEIGDPPIVRRQGLSSFVYDLRSGEGAGGSYFAEIAGFSERVVRQAEKCAGKLLDRYFVHAVNILREPPASRGEAAIDLLEVGALLSLHGNSARHVPKWVLAELQRLSWKCGRPTVTAGILREALSRTYIKVDDGKRHEAGGAFRVEPDAVFDDLAHLADWLLCTVDLAESSRCVVNWTSALRTLPRNEACLWIETAMELFRWFETAADEALGKYTRGVPAFLENQHDESRRREDRFLRGKEPAAYHLAMVAAEIANQAVRPEFARRSRKVVLLPACVRGVNARACPGSQSGGLDVHCSRCDSACGVNTTTEAIETTGTRVYLENCPRNSLRVISRWGSERRAGFVVVACLANLRAVQQAARWIGMTCQFLPLDFPGCRSHWRKARVPTSLNLAELDRLLAGARTRKPCSLAARPTLALDDPL